MPTPQELLDPKSQYYAGTEGYARPGEDFNAYKARVGIWPDAAPATPAPEAPRYSRLSGEAMSGYEAQRSNLESIVRGSIEPVDENAIREEKRKNAQSVVDSIRAQFNRVLAEERQAGEQRNARTRALNVSAGLGGSDFASSAAQKTEDANRKIEQDTLEERDTKIAEILAEVDSNATEEIRARKQQNVLNAEKSLSLMKDIQERARKNLTDLAAAGVTLEALKSKDPESYQKLIDTSGDDPLIVEAIFNNAADARNRAEYTYHSLGDGRVLRTGKKGDGSAVKEEIFNYPSLTKDMQLVITPDGTPLVFDKATGEAKLAPGFREGQFVKPAESTGVDTSGMTSKQVTVFNSIVDKYNRSPLIQASDRTVILDKSIEAIRKDPKNAANQLNLSYSYIQALDTYQSAVREGELANLNSIDSRIGNLQGSIQKIQNGQIVRPEVAKQIADSADLIVKAIKTAARSKADSFAAQAKVSGIENAWSEYQSSFSASYTKTGDTGPEAELENDIQSAPAGKTREQIIDELLGVYPELTEQQIHDKVYEIIPDK